MWIVTPKTGTFDVFIAMKNENGLGKLFTVIYIPPRGILQRTRQSVRQKHVEEKAGVTIHEL